jgi:hypothetical protein
MPVLPTTAVNWFFALYRRPDVSDQEFAEDAKSVEKDLAKLKTLLEK